MAVSVWLVAVLVILLSIAFCRRFDKPQDSVLKPLPGPFGLPWLGYLPWIDAKAPYETFAKLGERYGRVYALKLGGLLAVFVSDPTLIRQAFNRDVFTGRAPLYLTHGIMKGHGLICSEGEMWREHRRFVVTVMKKLGMSGRGSLMESRIMDAVLEFIEGLQESVGRAEGVNLIPGLRHCIGNMINSVVFGRTYDKDDPTWIYLQHLLDEGVKQVAVAGPLNFLPVLRFLPQFRRTMSFILEGQSETHRHYQEIIDAHVAPGPDQGCRDIIEAYLVEMERRRTSGEGEGSFTVRQLHHVLADLFGAGTDTALTTVKWIVLYMILHPDVQNRVHEEIDRVIGAERTPCYAEDAERMPWTEAVICEVQRIDTILPLGVPHGSLQETELGGFRIPKGAMIVPLLWAVNRDPTLYGPDPLAFRPERFLDPSTGTLRKPEWFMPFQCGRRMCIGDELGRSVIFLFTVTLLQRFRLSFPDGFRYDPARMKPEYGFTLVPPVHPVVLTAR